MQPAAQRTRDAAAAAPAGVLTNKAFMRVWLLSLLSNLSFSAYMLAESWYVINELGERSWLGIIMMATTLPHLLFLLIGGALADRISKTRLMSMSLLGRGALLLAMAGLAVFGALTVYPLLAFAFLFGAANALFTPAMMSLIPSLLGKDQLIRGNSLVQTGNQTVMVLGPVVGGALLGLFSYSLLFACAGSVLLLTGMLLLRLRVETGISDSQGLDAARSVPVSPVGSIVEGFRYMRTAPVLLSLGLMNVFTNLFITGPGSLSIPLIANDVLRGTALHLSFLESAIAAGMIAGALVAGALNLKRRRGFLLLGQLLALGLTFVLLSASGSLWQAVALFAVMGLAITFGSVPMQTMIQQQTEPHMMGRVMAMMSALSTGLVPLSFAAASSLLAAGVPITSLLLACGCIVLVYFVLLLLFARRIREIE